MEVFGIVTGVLGLLPLCRDGLGMLRDVFDAPRTLELSVGRLELQRDKYDQWRDVWRSDDGELDMGFEAYTKSSLVAGKRMLRQLSLLALVLFDVHALEDKYGLKPTHWPDRMESKDLSRFKLKEGEFLTIETQGGFLERCKLNLAFVKRCKFALRRKEAPWVALIDSVKDHIQILTTYGPKAELSIMAKAEIDILRKMQLEELRRRADAATFEARNPQTPIEAVEKYNTYSLAAQFGVVVRFERQHTAVKFTMRDFRIDSSYIISSSRTSTMALLFDYPVKKENRVVLIEWMDESDRNLDRDTKTTTLILATAKPDELLLPKCYGMVEDPVKRRLGLVLAPPAHIRANLPPIMPQGAISQKRMPVSLRELIGKRHPSCQQMLDLGIRFQLAKKFLKAVHMMHNVGWIHKNIRSSSILFFPEANIPSRGSGPPSVASGNPQPIGYLEPLFVGMGSARPDQLNIPLPLSSPPHSNSYYSSDEDDDEPEESVFIDEYGQRLIRIREPPRPRRRRERHPEPEPMLPDLDYYQHPEKRWVVAEGRDRGGRGGRGEVGYSRGHDIYSLGCVLLELGLWNTLDKLVEVEDEDFERVRRGFQSLTMSLDGIAGSIYGNVVRRCLAVNTRERNESEARELSRFMAEIEASLDMCCA